MLQVLYTYNALGQQTVRRLTQAGHTIHSVHDADGNRLAEYEIDNVSGAATLLQEYIWHDGVPVAVVDGATDAVFFVRTDHIGRPVFATSDTGVKVWEATYLPFGGVHSTTGSAIDLRFPGQWFQSESGLHQNWMREYDPTTGRYMQGDPFGLVDGASVYGYALQNPVRYTDPTGEFIPALAAGFLAGYGGFMTGHELGELIFGSQCIDLEELASLVINFIPGGKVGKKLPDVVDKMLPDSVTKHIDPRQLLGRQRRDEMTGNQIKRLRKQMREKGFDPKHPIDVADVDGKLIILDGHHRTRAAIGEGIDTVPVNIRNVTKDQGTQLLNDVADAQFNR